MVFGRPRARRAEGLVAATAIAIALAFAATTLSSCGAANERRRSEAYSASLSAIDAMLASPAPKGMDQAFTQAYRSARSASDWLCLLKRARVAQAKGDAGRYSTTADRALKAFPKSEPVAAAAAHAYLRNGDPRKALALFGSAISVEARPKLWAEAFISSMASRGFEASSAGYGMLAEITGDPRPFMGAAATALKAGDRIAAAAWLEKAVSGGATVPTGLLWDCGLYEALARASDASFGPAELALKGDAAWMSGDIESAKRSWARSIALAPTSSWKPYANLAILSKGDVAVGYWTRMKAAFLSGPPSTAREGSLASYAAYLAREGRDAEARSALKGGEARVAGGALAVLELGVRGRSMQEGRYVAELERLAAERPDDPEIMDAVLRDLSIRGMYGELAVL